MLLVVVLFTPILETKIDGVPERPKEVVAKDTDEIPVRFAPLPENEVAVTTPDALRLVAAIVPTEILGVQERPKKVVAKDTEEILVRIAPDQTKEVAMPTQKS